MLYVIAATRVPPGLSRNIDNTFYSVAIKSFSYGPNNAKEVEQRPVEYRVLPDQSFSGVSFEAKCQIYLVRRACFVRYREYKIMLSSDVNLTLINGLSLSKRSSIVNLKINSSFVGIDVLRAEILS